MLENLIKKILIIISIIVIGIITVLNLFFISNIMNDVCEKVDINQITVLSLSFSFLIAAIIIMVSMLLEKIKISKKITIIIAVSSILLYAVLAIVWINLSVLEPCADQKEVNKIAIQIINNEIEEIKISDYLRFNPQQIGISYIIVTIYKIFNTTDYHIIQYINVLCNVVTYITMYNILKKFLKEYVSNKILYLIITLTFIPMILLVTFVYGDYIGLMFSIISIYFIMKYTDTRKIIYLIISALAISISYIAKSNYLIFILGSILYLVMDVLKDRKWKRFILVMLFVLISFLPNTILSSIVSKQFELGKNKSIPASTYIYMGMNEGDRQNGWYNSTADYAWENIDDARNYYPQKIKERLIEFAKSPLYTVKFYAKKTISMWTEVTFGGIWYNLPFQIDPYEAYLEKIAENHIFNSVCEGKLNFIIVSWQKALVLIIFAGTLIATWNNRKNMNLNFLLLLIIAIGGFFFHTIWEAKSRYVLPYVIILIPLSVIGIEEILLKFKKKRS